MNLFNPVINIKKYDKIIALTLNKSHNLLKLNLIYQQKKTMNKFVIETE